MMKTFKRIKCAHCDGFGVVDTGYHYPDECRACGGSGTIIRYESGTYASYIGGPFLGRDSKADRGASGAGN